MCRMKLGSRFLISTLLITIGCIGEQKTLPGEAVAPPSTAAVHAADPANGQHLFAQNCALCHGMSGKGDGTGSAALDPKPRDFTNAAYMQKLSDQEIRNTIRYGGAMKKMPQMPSNPQYNDQELSDLVAYVRSLSSK